LAKQRPKSCDTLATFESRKIVVVLYNILLRVSRRMCGKGSESRFKVHTIRPIHTLLCARNVSVGPRPNKMINDIGAIRFKNEVGSPGRC